jgi:hypothetical protein
MASCVITEETLDRAQSRSTEPEQNRCKKANNKSIWKISARPNVGSVNYVSILISIDLFIKINSTV